MLSGPFSGKCRRAILFFCLFFCWCVTAKAQYFSLDSNRKRVIMPFLFIRNLVVIKLKINNHGPYNFILDTGVGQMLITEPSLIDSLEVYTQRPITITGFGAGENYDAYLTAPLKVDIKGLVSHNVSAAILNKDLLGLSGYAGMHIHGLLGYEFFNQLAVKVDFEDTVITVCRPKNISPFKKGVKIPMSIEQNRPYIETNVTCDDGTESRSKLIVDLGAGHAISLEHIEEKGDFSGKVIAGNLGVGLKGLISGYLGRVKAVDLGKYKLTNLIASYPEDNFTKSLLVFRDGNMGVDLLKRFTLIFDYSGGALYLKSNTKYHDPFEHDMSGLEYYATGNDYRHIIIDRVEPGSAGEIAGLEKNYEITAINFKSVEYMTLEQIDALFKSRDNRTILVEFYHDKKYDRTVLMLKRRI
ncbi:MAG TPA: aspartyl protease family protein [Mucilaginibacter sp.]